MIDRIELWAEKHELTRSAAVRELMELGLRGEKGAEVSRILNYWERNALREMSTHHDEFFIEGEFAADVGASVLDELVTLGLAEKGPSQRYRCEPGWRITDDGWRCMYGCTAEEIAQGDRTLLPLQVWRWPPERP